MQDFQSLHWAKSKIEKRFEKNPRASISTMFRQLRSSPKLSLFGDYPLISYIGWTLKEIGIPVTRPKLRYALRQSPELKGDKRITSLLINQ